MKESGDEVEDDDDWLVGRGDATVWERRKLKKGDSMWEGMMGRWMVGGGEQ